MIRRTIPKHIRQQVYEKYGGHCAYCGKALEYKEKWLNTKNEQNKNITHRNA